MPGFLLVLLLVVLLIRWVIIRNRLRELEHRIEDLSNLSGGRRTEELVAALTRRVHALESAQVQAVQEAREPVPVAPEIPQPEVVESPPAPQVLICPVCAREVGDGSGMCFCGYRFGAEPPAALPPPLPVAPALEAEPERVPERVPEPVAAFSAEPPAEASASAEFGVPKPKMRSQDWEALVGGNWLNKLGVLLLVIGVAFLLSYGFTQTGPLGRVGMGLLVSLAMLGIGAWVERRPGYQVFGRGLLGGGWSALYFTTYATHAIAAARVIDNPYIASGLLFGVAAGMIVHSLHYRSQTVSGLAYFIAFATLILSDVTVFAVVALIPLAASLLFIAYRFSWFAMALFGLFATWGTLISRGDSGAPLASTQAIFASYWLLFEIFDLMRTARRSEETILTQWILPVNAAAFLLLSWRKWETAAPEHTWMFFAAAGAAYLVSALLRVKVRPPSSFAPERPTLDRLRLGGYEGPLTIAALLVGISIFLKAPTVWINAGLLLEAELLFAAALLFGEKYPRWLSVAVFGVSIGKLGLVDVPAAGNTTLFGLHLRVWTPVAMAHAAAFYLNRVLRKSAREFSWAAAAVVVGILSAEMPREYLAVALMVYAVVLFELGFRARLQEFRLQAYFSGTLGVIMAALLNTLAPDPAWRMQWLPLAICTLISYAAAIRVRAPQPDRIVDWEAKSLRQAGAAATTFLSMALVWKLAPGDYLGLAWMAVGFLLLELGLRGLPGELRWMSYAASAIGAGRLALLDVLPVTKSATLADRVSLAGAALICYAATARVIRSRPASLPDRERRLVRDLNCFAGTAFLMTVTWVVLPDAVVAVAWAALGLVLLETGFAATLPSFRFLGNLVSAAVFGRLFFANFTDLGHTGWLSHRLLTVLPVIAAEYYISARYKGVDVRDRERNASRLYLYAAAILAVILSRFELGRVLTVAGWAGLTVAFYVTGVRKNNVHLRWQSYAVAALTFWRCWDTNFYVPESLAGMPGRVAMGGLVVAAFYAAQLLSPRAGSGGQASLLQRIDQHARLLFAVLASALLAVLLYYEVSGGILTVAWTVQAMAMLVAGFPLRDRPLRLLGLLEFLVCILKVFLWDLRHLETLQRIVSFMVLGLILVAVSWIYTRFRGRIQRYL